MKSSRQATQEKFDGFIMPGYVDYGNPPAKGPEEASNPPCKSPSDSEGESTYYSTRESASVVEDVRMDKRADKSLRDKETEGAIDRYLKSSGISTSKWYRTDGEVELEVRTQDVNPSMAHDYFIPLFQSVGIKGKFVLTRKTTLSNGFMCFSFTGMCPLHMKDHLGDYGDWQYKVSPGRYAGFKCWSDNSWETTYKFEELPLLEKM